MKLNAYAHSSPRARDLLRAVAAALPELWEQVEVEAEEAMRSAIVKAQVGMLSEPREYGSPGRLLDVVQHDEARRGDGSLVGGKHESLVVDEVQLPGHRGRGCRPGRADRPIGSTVSQYTADSTRATEWDPT